MSQSALSFSDGGSALLRDPRQVPVKIRRIYDHAKLALAGVAAGVSDEVVVSDNAPEDVKKAQVEQQQKLFVIKMADQPELMDKLNDAAILALVSEWSYGAVTQDVLESLPGDSYDVLQKKCDALAVEMSPNFAVTDDPKAITSDSGV